MTPLRPCRHRRVALLLACALTLEPMLAHADDLDDRAANFRAPGSPFHWDPALDIGLLSIAVPVWVIPHFYDEGLAPPTCGQPGNLCDKSKVPWFDRPFMYYHPDLRMPGQILFVWGPLIVLPALALDYQNGAWRDYLTDLSIIVESWAWSAFLTHVFRYAVRRPRPYLYEDGQYLDHRYIPDATMSFFSGHTSEIFGFGVAAAYIMTLRRGARSWRSIVMWSTMIALGTTIGIMRVGAGDHFLSDVVIGAIAGTGCGLLIPYVHRRKGQPAVRYTVTPVVSQTYTGLSFGGRF